MKNLDNRKQKEPKMLKILPYKLKMAFLTVAGVAVPFLSSCKKEKVDPYAEQKDACAALAGEHYWDDTKNICISPIAEKIKELTAQEKKLAGEVRGAVLPALTQPDDVQEWYWGVFEHWNVPRGTNLLDSVNVHIAAIDNIYDAYGNPVPFNNETIAKLYEKCNAYIPVATELNSLLQR